MGSAGLRVATLRRSRASLSFAMSEVKGTIWPLLRKKMATRSPGETPWVRNFRAALRAGMRSPGPMLRSSKSRPRYRAGGTEAVGPAGEGPGAAGGPADAEVVAAWVAVSALKAVISRGLPPSSTVKLSRVSPPTECPRLSRTTTPTSTRRVSALTTYCARGAQLEARKLTSLGGMLCCAGRKAVSQSRTGRHRRGTSSL